jgi:DNA-binding beta-propeller fold protein YncE
MMSILSWFVYVADYDNNRIQVFDSNGTFITSYGTEGEGDGQFLHPHVAAVDSEVMCM